MVKGPFGGPRPFTSASMVVSFTFSQDPGFTDLEIEKRLRRNGVGRADVQKEKSKTDSRVQVRVITNSERMNHDMVERLIAQVKSEAESSIGSRDIDIYCT